MSYKIIVITNNIKRDFRKRRIKVIEIFGILFLSNRINRILEMKGQESIWYQLMIVPLWILGEIIGAIVGIIITDAKESARLVVYLFALGGAIICSGVLYLYADSLPEMEKEEEKIAPSIINTSIEEPTKEWECPECKSMNPNTTYTCRNCGLKL
jgi:hypothetical protein